MNKWIEPLRESLANVKEFVGSLTDDEFVRPPAQGWSVRDNLEHLILVEGRVLRGIQFVCSRPGAPPAEPLPDETVWDRALGAGRPAPAPESVLPTGSGGSRVEMLAKLSRLRQESIEYASSTTDPLRERTVRMPVGELNGEQCFGMLAAHMERHLRQMRAVLDA
ncbi:MAG: DinB family protein [Acidobacteria bacterium]|nr:DinB family protein [Acidobacteriota bacterium]